MPEPVCEFCGHSGIHPECKRKQAEFTRRLDEEEQAVWKRFGFAQVRGEQGLAWQQQVFTALDADITPDTSVRVFENDVAVFVDHGYIGSRGILLRKHDETCVRLGSYCPGFVQVWGFMVGVNLHTRTNTLVLTQMRDRAKTIERLRPFFTARMVRNEIVPALERGETVTLEDLDLFFAIRDLYEAERSDAFAFEVRPTKDRSRDAPASG